MKNKGRLFFGLGFISIISVSLSSCGDTGTNQLPNPSSPPGNSPAILQDLGEFSIECNGSSRGGAQQQSQKVPFPQQQQTGCNPQQKFEFKQSEISNFDLRLNCEDRVLVVKNKGLDEKEKQLPIQSDGSVQGEIQ